ncbi:MAG: autotransporter assembly complex family protein [Pseudomonadota bacterium]
MKTTIPVLAAVAALLIGAAPAKAIEIFGRTFFEREDEADGVRVIDPQPYVATFQVAGDNGDLENGLKQASTIWTSRDEPASGSAGLIAAAQGDYRNLLAYLYAEGYYGGAISIRIAGREATDVTLTADLPEGVQVDIAVDPGPLFRFGQTQVINPPPPRPREDTGDEPVPERFQPGREARADVIGLIGDDAILGWRLAGHPKAELAGREAIADHAENTLDVRIDIAPGPAARFGPVTVEDTRPVDPDFIKYIANLPEGDPFSPAEIDAAIARLNRLGVFRAARIIEAEEVAPDGSLPLTIRAVPQKPRRFGLGATASSTEGIGFEAFWLHRNLFGRAERLRFDGSIGGLGDGGIADDIDLGLGVSFVKPGVFDPDTDLETSAFLEQNVFDTFEEQKAGVSFGFSRIFTENLEGSAAVDLTFSEVTDDLGERQFLTLGLPVSLAYDVRDNPLDATRGYFIEGTARPFAEFEFDTLAIRTLVSGRTFFEVIEDRTVLAFRAQFGTVFGGALDELNPDELFFTGGGGSVRGFEFRSNGIDVDGDILGGRSAVELSAEVRQRFTRRFGGALFVDGGLVSEEIFPVDTADLTVGVGVGLRFYTALGPLRVDVASAVDRDDDDPPFAVYIGIGQAF